MRILFADVSDIEYAPKLNEQEVLNIWETEVQQQYEKLHKKVDFLNVEMLDLKQLTVEDFWNWWITKLPPVLWQEYSDDLDAIFVESKRLTIKYKQGRPNDCLFALPTDVPHAILNIGSGLSTLHQNPKRMTWPDKIVKEIKQSIENLLEDTPERKQLLDAIKPSEDFDENRWFKLVFALAVKQHSVDIESLM